MRKKVFSSSEKNVASSSYFPLFSTLCDNDDDKHNNNSINDKL